MEEKNKSSKRLNLVLALEEITKEFKFRVGEAKGENFLCILKTRIRMRTRDTNKIIMIRIKKRMKKSKLLGIDNKSHIMKKWEIEKKIKSNIIPKNSKLGVLIIEKEIIIKK